MGDENKKMNSDDDVISLVDILKVLFKWKRLIIGGVVLAVIAAVIVTKVRAKKYCVQTVVEVGQMAVRNRGYMDLENPESLTAKITSAYAQVVGSELGIPGGQFPAVTASNPKHTSVVNIRLDTKNIKEGKQILANIDEKILKDHKRLINETIADLRGEIEKAALKEKETRKQISFMGDDLKRLAEQEKRSLETFDLKIAGLASQKRTAAAELKLKDEEKKTLAAQLKDTRKRLNELYALKDKASQSAGDQEAIGLLLFANEISTRQHDADDLDMKLNVTLASEKKDMEQKIEDLSNTIDQTGVDRANALLDFDAKKKDLEEKISGAEFDIQEAVLNREKLESLLHNMRETRVLMQPALCGAAITSPGKSGVIAGGVALFFFTFLAFFLEFWRKNKEEIRRS